MARWLREDAPVFVADDPQASEDLAGELASVTMGSIATGISWSKTKTYAQAIGAFPRYCRCLKLHVCPGIDAARYLARARPPWTSANVPWPSEATSPPGSPRTRDASIDDSVWSIQEAVRRRWGVSGYDEYDDV